MTDIEKAIDRIATCVVVRIRNGDLLNSMTDTVHDLQELVDVVRLSKND